MKTNNEVDKLMDQIAFYAWAFSFFAPALAYSVKRAVVGETTQPEKPTEQK